MILGVITAEALLPCLDLTFSDSADWKYLKIDKGVISLRDRIPNLKGDGEDWLGSQVYARIMSMQVVARPSAVCIPRGLILEFCHFDNWDRRDHISNWSLDQLLFNRATVKMLEYVKEFRTAAFRLVDHCSPNEADNILLTIWLRYGITSNDTALPESISF